MSRFPERIYVGHSQNGYMQLCVGCLRFFTDIVDCTIAVSYGLSNEAVADKLDKS